MKCEVKWSFEGMNKFQFSNLSQDQKQEVVDELVQQMQWLFDLEEETL